MADQPDNPVVVEESAGGDPTWRKAIARLPTTRSSSRLWTDPP